MNWYPRYYGSCKRCGKFKVVKREGKMEPWAFESDIMDDFLFDFFEGDVYPRDMLVPACAGTRMSPFVLKYIIMERNFGILPPKNK